MGRGTVHKSSRYGKGCKERKGGGSSLTNDGVPHCVRTLYTEPHVRDARLPGEGVPTKMAAMHAADCCESVAWRRSYQVKENERMK